MSLKDYELGIEDGKKIEQEMIVEIIDKGLTDGSIDKMVWNKIRFDIVKIKGEE